MSSRTAITTPAVVIRLVDFGESDKVVGLFTRSHGLVSAVARGARRSRKRFAGVLQSGHVLEVDFVPSMTALARLDGARLISAYLGIIGDLGRLEEAFVVLRSVRDHMAEGVPDESLFDELVDYLGALDRAGPDELRLVRFRLGFVDRLGVGPELERCVVCGTRAPDDRSAGFDPERGGLVCRSCGGSTVILSASCRALARSIRLGETLGDELPAAAAELRRAIDLLSTRHLAHRR